MTTRELPLWLRPVRTRSIATTIAAWLLVAGAGFATTPLAGAQTGAASPTASTTGSTTGSVAATPTAAECQQILERWAVDPKNRLRNLVDQCQAMPPAVPATASAGPAALDPCNGTNAGSNVQCWGPWAGLAPAAGPSADTSTTPLRSPDQRPELAEQLTPDLFTAGCLPGAPCGFATVVSGVKSSDTPERTEFARIDLAPDCRSFVIRRLDGSVIASVPMSTVVTPRPDGYGNLRANGATAAEQSRLVARVIQDESGRILLAADIWGHGSPVADTANSGYFAWGTATSQADLDALNAGNVTATFSGPMSVDKATTGTITVDFGATPTWTGNWNNTGTLTAAPYQFSAGGGVSGANLVSVPGQFSSNVVADQSLVRGAVVGEAGNRGITHLIDVTLAGQGIVKDVGLLREVVTPGAAP